jgi:hypothetical protein
LVARQFCPHRTDEGINSAFDFIEARQLRVVRRIAAIHDPDKVLHRRVYVHRNRPCASMRSTSSIGIRQPPRGTSWIACNFRDRSARQTIICDMSHRFATSLIVR